MILNIHALTSKSRMTNIQHSLFLGRHLGNDEVNSINILLYDPSRLEHQTFNLCIINYEVIAYRTSPLWPYIERKLKNILKLCERKILIVQDDYTNNLALQSFIKNFSIDVVYTAVKKDLHLLYRSIIKTGVRIEYFPTGLVEACDLSLYENARQEMHVRRFGSFSAYRTLPSYFGRQGVIKSDAINSWCQQLDNCKSNEFELIVGSNLFGTNWLNKLSEFQFAIHHKGGASLIDKVGELRFVTKIFGESSFIAKKLISVAEKNSSRIGDFSASGPRLIEAILLRCVILAPPDEYELNLSDGETYIEIDSKDALNSVSRLKNIESEHLESLTNSALQLLNNNRLFHYCDKATEILNFANGGSASEQYKAHTHKSDSITALIIEMSELYGSHSIYTFKEQISNRFLKNVISRFQFDPVDLYCLAKLDSDFKSLNEDNLGLIYLNKENGIPIAL
jgi:hypothetical protein